MDLNLIIVIALVALVALVITCAYLAREFINPKGKNAYKKTAGILARFALPRGFKVLKNVQIGTNDKSIIAENILIGYFGILIVRTLGAKGSYYGTLESDKWSIVRDEKKAYLPNAVLQLKQDEAAVRAVFANKNIYNIPIEYVVYMTNKSNKTQLHITNSGEILTPGKLGGYLNKTKFEKDAGIDVKKIASVLS